MSDLLQWAVDSLGIRLLVIAVVLVAAYQIVTRDGDTKGKLPLPPSPPGLPLIGNIVAIAKAASKNQQHLVFYQWARTYGPVYRIKIGPITEYYLNTDLAVKEIFDRASAQTAERPRWIVSNEQICNKWNVLLLNGSDPRWKHQRKATHVGLTSVPKADAGLPFLHYETAKFVYDIVKDPEMGMSSANLWKGIGRYTYSTFAAQTYGMEIRDNDDPVIDYIFETGEAQILGTLPGYHPVDVFPVLDKLPLFLKPWERNARARHRRDLSWCMERLERIKTGIRNGSPSVQHDAFLPSVLEDEKHLGFEDEREAAYLSLMLLLGAADTSKMSTWSMLEAMMRFPEVQNKLHDEIVRVVGTDRLPVFEDLESIPYVRCVMKEVWRWRPPVAMGHPHTTTRELEFGGHRIPKGARIHLNSYAIGHDPNRHEDHDRFWPERFENDLNTTMQAINLKDVTQRDHFAFGAGRRVCPGYHVGERSLCVSILRLVWAFHIEPAAGTPLPMDPASYAGEFPGNPGMKMPVTLRLRTDKKETIIRDFEHAKSARPMMEKLA